MCKSVSVWSSESLIMDKKMCNEFFSKSTIVLIMFLAFPHLIGMKHWTRNGWSEPSLKLGIFLSLVALIMYIYNKKYCRSPIIYKCTECHDVFDERNLKKSICPNCEKESLISITKSYHNTSYKNDTYHDYISGIITLLVILFPIFYIIYYIAGKVFSS